MDLSKDAELLLDEALRLGLPEADKPYTCAIAEVISTSLGHDEIILCAMAEALQYTFTKNHAGEMLHQAYLRTATLTHDELSEIDVQELARKQRLVDADYKGDFFFCNIWVVRRMAEVYAMLNGYPITELYDNSGYPLKSFKWKGG